MPGPLDDAINQLNQQIGDGEQTDLNKAIELLDKRAKGPQKGPTPGGLPTSSQPDQRTDTLHFDEEPPELRQFREAELRQEPGLTGKVIGRLFGTDVEDPIEWTRLATTVGGAVGGGVAGASVPGPPVVRGIASALGAVGGTVAGAAAPEATLEALEAVDVLDPGTRQRIGLDNEDLKTIMEGEALLELATGGTIGAFRLGSRGISNLLTGAGSRQSRRLSELATREQIALTPIQVGERSFGRGFVSVMGRFPWVASALKRRAQRAMNQIQNAFERVPQRFGPMTTFDEASRRILRESEDTVNAINQQFSQRYTDLLQQADFRGIRVRPTNTRAVTNRVLRQISRETPQGVNNVRGQITKGGRLLREFISRNTGILSEGNQIADQSMRQMDTLLTSIDEFMPTLAKAGDAKAMGRLDQLRQAIQADMLGNAIGPGADQLATEFRRVDHELTSTIDALFNTAAARRAGIQVHPAGRSARATGTGMRGTDDLAQVILRGNSPTIVDELASITNPQTMRQLTGAVMNDAIQKSFVQEADNTIRFDADTFARQLGLDDASSAKYRQTERLMQHSGGMAINDLRDLVDVARRASRAEIPDVSTFIARRATIGGIRSAVETLKPWAIVGATTYGTSAIGGLIAIGGSKLLSNMISDPKSARALSRVLDEEVRTTVRRSALIRAVAFGSQNAYEAGEFTLDQMNNTMEAVNYYTDQIDDWVTYRHWQ